jgi:hypothetical protein
LPANRAYYLVLKLHLGDEMKKFLIAGLLAAIGSVALVSQSHAASRYCIYNPDDPACYDGNGYDGNGYDDSDLYPPPPPRRHNNSYNDGYYGDNYDNGPVLSFRFGADNNRCQKIANSLRRSGFRNVRAVDCAGRDFAYLARRDGQRLRVIVKSSTGRISQIRPN